MWTCPICGRIFKNPKQDHISFYGNLSDYFKGKLTKVSEIYENH